MSVAYEGYWANAIRAGVDIAAACATFTTEVGAGVAAKDRIIEISGGREDAETLTASSGATFSRKTAPCWLHLCPDPAEVQSNYLATQSLGRDVTIPWCLYLRPAGISAEHEVLRYALSKAGKIAAEMEAQRGQTSTWRRISCSFAGMQILDPSGYGRGLVRVGAILTAGDF